MMISNRGTERGQLTGQGITNFAANSDVLLVLGPWAYVKSCRNDVCFSLKQKPSSVLETEQRLMTRRLSSNPDRI